MSLLHMDGFAQFGGASSTANLISALNKAGYLGGSNVNSVVPGTASGTSALQISRTSNDAAPNARAFSTTADKWWTGFAFKSSERRPIVNFPGLFTLDWRAGVSIGTTNGTAIPARNIWYYYEFEFDRTAREFRVYINNSLDLAVPMDATQAALESFSVEFAPGIGYEAAAVTQVTDLIINDSSGDGRTAARLGPVVLTTQRPTADFQIPGGDAPPRWTPASGNSHFDMVDNVPPIDSQYLLSGTTGAMDLFTATGDLVNTNDVLAVGMVVNAKKTDIDNRKLGLVFGGTPGAQAEVIQSELSLDYKTYYAMFDKAPGGAEWTIADATNTPFGIVVR